MFTGTYRRQVVPIWRLLWLLNVLKRNKDNTYHERVRQYIALEELAELKAELFGEEKPTQ
jgi:hypothetical protein